MPFSLRVLFWFISLALSLLLWINFGQKEPVTQREIQVAVVANNLAERYLVRLPETVTVVAEGTPSALQSLKTEDLAATIDMRAAKPGRQPYDVLLTTPPRMPVALNLKSPVLNLTIEKLASVRREIELETLGQAPSEFRYDGATLEPSNITVFAPESALGLITEVRAVLELKTLRPGMTKVEVPVLLVDSKGRPVPNAKAEPAMVSVYPALAAAEASKNLVINPRWKGQLPFGYEVTSYTVVPTQLRVSGTSSALAALTSLETDGFDLSGITRSTTRTVKIRVPQGIQNLPTDEVQITLEVGKSATVPTGP